MFQSETCSVDDTYKYYTDTYSQGNSNRQVELYLELPSAFKITYTYNNTNSSSSYAQIIYGKDYGTLDYLINHNIAKIEYLKRVNSSSATTITSTGNNYPINTSYDVEFTYNNGVHTIKVNGVQAIQVTDTSVSIEELLRLSIRNTSVSNLKVYRL